MSRAELARLLGTAAAAPGTLTAEHVRLLGLGRAPTAAEHTELFALQVYPYASVHLGPQGKLGGVARDRVAGFLRALQVVPPPEPDHLAVLLDAHAQLIDLDEDGAGPRVRRARTVLLHEHLASWAPRLTHRVAELGAEPFRRWAALLDDLVDAELDLLGPPPGPPAHLREAPDLTGAAGDGAEALVDALLAPVRSGLVLARADLRRAADELGLGLRIGERAYTLTALLQQDAHATLRWIADEARRQRACLSPAPDPTTSFWRARLDGSAGLLDDLVTGHGVPVAG
jgi:TorA maturation chaperone TorD